MHAPPAHVHARRPPTCATEADASGTGSMEENTSDAGRPSSRSMMGLMAEKDTGSVRSRHFWNSSTYLRTVAVQGAVRLQYRARHGCSTGARHGCSMVTAWSVPMQRGKWCGAAAV